MGGMSRGEAIESSSGVSDDSEDSGDSDKSEASSIRVGRSDVFDRENEEDEVV